MNIILLVFLTLYLLICSYSSYWVYKHVNKVKRLHKKNESREIIDEYFMVRRDDLEHLDPIRYAIGGFFLMPIRIFLVFGLLANVVLFIKIIMSNKKSIQELPTWKIKLIKGMVKITARTQLLLFGFYYIKVVHEKINDYDRSYEVDQSKSQQAPVLISNHVSWVDSFYLISRYCPSFLAKREVSKIPLVGILGEALQFFWVDREDRQAKNNLLDQIGIRIDSFSRQKNVPPLLIFPEGTTTNGRALITFKKGPFFKITPIQIICLEYPQQDFNLFIDSFELLACAILAACRLKNELIEHKFDIYHPTGLNQSNPDDWKIYAEKIRTIMSKCLKIPKSEKGLHDFFVYMDILLKGMTQQQAIENQERKLQLKEQNLQQRASTPDQNQKKRD